MIALPLTEVTVAEEDSQVLLTVITEIMEFAQKVVILILPEIKPVEEVLAPKFLSESEELIMQEDLQALSNPMWQSNPFPSVIKQEDGFHIDQES